MYGINNRLALSFGAAIALGSFLFPPFITGLLSLLFIVLSAMRWKIKGGLFSSLFASLIMVLSFYSMPTPHFTSIGLITILTVYLLVGFSLGHALAMIKDRQEQIIQVNRKAQEDLQQSIAYYETLLDSIHDPLHVVDPNMVLVYANQEMEKQLHHFYGAREIVGQPLSSIASFLNDKVHEEYASVFETGKPLVTEEAFEIEGETIYTETTKSPMLNEEGHVAFIVTIVRDISERKGYEREILNLQQEAENGQQSLLSVLNSMETGIYVTDMETYEILFINHYTEKIFGNVVGKLCWQTFHEGNEGPCSFCTNDKLLEANGQPRGVYQWELYNEKTNRWYELQDSAIYWHDGRLARLEIVLDSTEQKEAKMRMERQHRFQTMMASISATFLHTPKRWIDEAINKALELIGDFFQVDRVYLFQFSANGLYMSNTHEWCREGIAPQIDLIQNAPVKEMSWIVQEIYTKEYVSINDTTALPYEEEREEFLRQKIQSLLCMHLTIDNKVIGFLGMDSVSKKKTWELEEMSLLRHIIGVIGSALAKHQIENELEDRIQEIEGLYHQLDQEIEKAHEIHKQILPKTLPQIEGIHFAAHYQPAEKIGGDFYDVIQSHNKLIFYLSDVSGHGLDSAMLSFFIKHTIRGFVSFSPKESITPGKILRYLANQYKEESYPKEYFICIFVVVLDLETMEMTYSGAGFQDTPYVRRSNGQELRLSTKGLFITSYFPIEWFNFQEEKLYLEPGMTLFFNTDGFTEHGAPGAFYKDRLPYIFYKNAHLPPSYIYQILLEDFKRFNHGSLQGKDDITFLIMSIDRKVSWQCC